MDKIFLSGVLGFMLFIGGGVIFGIRERAARSTRRSSSA